jgi:hypothetical protein
MTSRLASVDPSSTTITSVLGYDWHNALSIAAATQRSAL